ncbi:MAG: sialate O-acetylesterase [Roseibacillus sp.]
MRTQLPLLFAGIAFGSSACLAIELPTMFSDHAVLQRGEAVPVWGWGEAGETVTVSFADQSNTGTAGGDGSWRVELGALKENATGRDLVVEGSKSGEVKVTDVLVGEVWMASGQSNMQWSLSQTERAKDDIPKANFPAMRMFLTDLATAVKPLRKVGGKWYQTTPENAGKFSAVGYYFALKVHREVGVPVGIIRTSWGGKPSEAFTSRETLSSKPEGKALVDRLDAEMKNFDSAKVRADYQKKLAAWEATRKANAAEPDPRKRRKIGRKPAMRPAPALSPNRPMSIYNAMIHPWVGYAMKGAIWYQGESNAGRAKEYETIFPLLILDWRKQWKNEMSYYFVQLANFRKPSTEPGTPNSWAELQNAQRLTLSLPGTGMAVINDIGTANNIHPPNKRDVGDRLARWALFHDYGRKEVVVCGPLYRGAKTEGGKIRISFEHAMGLKSRDGGPLQRFEISGVDQKWRWADATIEGASVVVSSKEVAQPVAVRYAWASNPSGANLVNGEGLPASLFRTDDWKLSTEK